MYLFKPSFTAFFNNLDLSSFRYRLLDTMNGNHAHNEKHRDLCLDGDPEKQNSELKMGAAKGNGGKYIIFEH